MEPDDYASFLVRCWRERADDDQRVRWRFEIEHIQRGERYQFKTVAELFAFLLHELIRSRLDVQGSGASTPAQCATAEDHHVG